MNHKIINAFGLELFNFVFYEGIDEIFKFEIDIVLDIHSPLTIAPLEKYKMERALYQVQYSDEKATMILKSDRFSPAL